MCFLVFSVVFHLFNQTERGMSSITLGRCSVENGRFFKHLFAALHRNDLHFIVNERLWDDFEQTPFLFFHPVFHFQALVFSDEKSFDFLPVKKQYSFG